MPTLDALLIGGVWRRTDNGTAGGGGGGVDRDDLVAGTYLPDETTTGTLPGVTRAAYTVPSQGLWTVSTPGTVIENLDMYGRIKPAASGVVIRNCRIFGSPPSASPGIDDHHPLIDMSSSLANDTVIEDCDLTPSPANEGPQAYGIKGGGFTTRRVHISRVVDGMQTRRWPVTDYGSYIHDLTYISPVDVTRSDGDPSHNDGLQLQGGSTTRLVGTRVDVTIPSWSNRSLTAVLVTNDYAVHQWIEWDRCFFAGGSIPVNVLGGSSTPAPTDHFWFTDSTVGLGQRNYGGGTPYWNVTAGTVVKTMWVESGNVREDTGSGPLLITG